MRKTLVLLMLALLVGAGAVVAQETTGEVKGGVTSQDGATLPGVTVTINDEETGYQRTSVTGANGQFRFVALKPGRYDLTGTLDGFQTYKRSIQVALGRTVTNDFVMQLGAVTDVIEVTGEAPLVDVTSTVSGITVNSDDLNANVPIQREATQVALLAPATVQGDLSFNNRTPGQSLASIGGASVAENSYQVNGLNVTNFRHFLGSTMVPFEFMDEIQVKTGGYEAEFGRSMGGVINMVTKSGSNAWHFDLNAYYNPKSLQESSPNTYAAANEPEDFQNLQLNASVGGRIIRDKLFFFVFGTYEDAENNIGELGDPDGVMTVRKTEGQIYYGGKADWNIVPSQRIEVTYLDDAIEQNDYIYDLINNETLGDLTGTGIRKRGGENWIARYTGIFGESFLLSGQYGSNAFDRTTGSSADATCPASYDSRDGGLTRLGCWVNFSAAAGADERTAYRVDGDIYVGNHSIRVGLDDEKDTSTDETFYSGNDYWRYYLNGDAFPQLPPEAEIVRLRHYNTGGTFETLSNAAYAQDSWAIGSSFTLNFGVRWESFDNKNANGESYIKISNQIAPRVGFIWDPSGQGRSKFFGSLGQYYMPIASNTNIRMAGSEFFDEAYYAYSGGINPDGSPGSLGEELEYRLISNGVIPDPRTNKDNSIDPMSQYEAILGYEFMMGSNWSLGVRGVARQYHRVLEDITIDEALYEVYGADYQNVYDCFAPDNVGACANEYRLTNPGTDFAGFYDLDGDGEADPVAFTAAQLGYPEGTRDYYAVELTFKRRFADNWMLQGSYTWSQSQGNYEGYVNSDLGQDDAGITESFDMAGLMEYAEGPLPNDRRHNLKVFGAYAWDFGFQVGANVYYTTGRPLNGFGVHPTDPWAQEYDNYAYYAFGEPSPRGSHGRTPDYYGLDLLLKYDFNALGLDWNVRLDAFNVANRDGVTSQNEFAEQATGNPNPNWLATTSYQTGRRIRFGFGLSF